jgi:REP element-mobilizing transposase RayT
MRSMTSSTTWYGVRNTGRKYSMDRWQNDLRELIREICKGNDIDIIKGSISKDHVHLFISVPPFLSVSKLVQSLKGKTSYKLLSEFKELSRAFLRSPHMGQGILCSLIGQRDRRGDHGIHSHPGS